MKEHDEEKQHVMSLEDYKQKLYSISQEQSARVDLKFKTVLQCFYEYNVARNVYFLDNKLIQAMMKEHGKSFSLALYFNQKSIEIEYYQYHKPAIQLFKSIVAQDQDKIDELIEQNKSNQLFPILAEQLMGRIFIDAVQCDQYELAQFLINNGVDVNVPNAYIPATDHISSVDMPIKYACTHFLKTEFNEKMVNLLLKNGLNLDLQLGHKSVFAYLMQSAPEEFLLKHVGNVKQVNHFECAPKPSWQDATRYIRESYLMIAVGKKHNMLAFELIKKGADVNYTCKSAIGKDVKVWDKAKAADNLVAIQLILISNNINLKEYLQPNSSYEVYNTQIVVAYNRLNDQWMIDRKEGKIPSIDQLFHRMKFLVQNHHLLVNCVNKINTIEALKLENGTEYSAEPLSLTSLKNCFSKNWWQSMLIGKHFFLDQRELDPEMLQIVGGHMFDDYYSDFIKENTAALHA